MQGREGWKDGWIQATDLLYICARIRGISLMMPAQEKGRKIYLSFYLACSSFCPQHISSVSAREENLQGGSGCFPTQCSSKNNAIFSNAACSSSLCLVSVPQLSTSPSQPEEVASFHIHFQANRLGELSSFIVPFPAGWSLPLRHKFRLTLMHSCVL